MATSHARVDNDHGLCMMAVGEEFSGRQSLFQRILDELEEDEATAAPGAARIGVDGLWTRAAFPSGKGFFSGDAPAQPYEEAENRRAPPSPVEAPKPPPLDDAFAALRRDVAATRCVEDLRRLRRRCALALHPDRVGADERGQAEKFMAELNAAIDRAIRERIPVADKPV
jgi:hypothetical protein